MAANDRDDATKRRETGERVKALRERAGLSRPRLAEKAGISAEMIKKVETGQRGLKVEAARRIAVHVGVADLVEIYGPGVQLSLDGRPPHPSVAGVRAALTPWSKSYTINGEPPTPGYLDGAVDAAWQTWHTSRNQRSETGAVLPGLLDQAQRAVRLLTDTDRRAALGSLSEVYHLAQAFLAWHGDRELMYLCVDRGMQAALDADDPLAIARSSWYAAHLLRSVGRSDEARQGLHEARLLIEPRVADGGVEFAEMLADIEMCDGLTRARSGDVGAWASLERARDIIHRALPADYVGIRTRVSRTLITVYAVMYAVDLGDHAEARRLARDLDPATIPSTERRARHYVELARAADLESSPEAALHLLQRAFTISGEVVQHSPPALELVRILSTESPAFVRGEAQVLARRAAILID